MTQVNYDINHITKILPHRYPFLLIDKIVEYEKGKRVVAIKNVTINEHFFAGHFPDFPLMPGVLIVEAMAQAGAFGVLSEPENQGKIAFFAGIDSVRFRRPTLPGDQLRIEVDLIKGRSNLFKMKGLVKVGDQTVCEGELMCSLVEQDSLSEASIHKTAIVHPGAKIGKGVRIGPHCVIGQDVIIGDNTFIGTNVVIPRWTTIGRDCKINHGATIGTPPQDLKYKGEKTEIVIGDRCTIREFVTIHLATGEGNKTIIGNDCMIMIHAHIPHNANIGNNVIIGGYSGISGHVEIEDFAIIGGMSAIHQFVRIGKLAMIGGQSKIIQDIPPFMLADGNPAQVRSLNTIGLMRRGVSISAQTELKKAFKILYKSHNNLTQAVDELRKKTSSSIEEINHLINFLEKETDRGILKKMEDSSRDDLIFPDIPELGI